MLKRLRIRMALINAVISGAILLAMAFAALHVSERAIQAQYERDLQQNASIVVNAVQRADANTFIAFASNYSVMVSDGTGARLVSADGTEAEPLKTAVIKTQDALEENLGGKMPAEAKIRSDNLVVTPSYVSVTVIENKVPVADEDESVGTDFYTAAEEVTYSVSNLLIDAAPKAYRVWARVAEGEPEQQVLVFQDRAQELEALKGLRWLFGACVLGGLVLTGFASLYLGTRSIRPVEQSIGQQRAFVAAASHELRTPIAAMRANAEVLQDAPLGDFEPYLSAITAESRRMSVLVSDLMELARADAGELQVRDEAVDAAQAMGRAASLLEPMARQKHQALVVSGDSICCRADGERLCQALVILVDNAIRYTQEGGTIRLSAAKEEQQVWIEVADNGPGIADAHKEKVFERFFRLDAARGAEGSGLGLSIARQLVEQMRGALTLTDAPGGGCAFRIKLRA
jgi:signal transduction histidine kinase